MNKSIELFTKKAIKRTGESVVAVRVVVSVGAVKRDNQTVKIISKSAKKAMTIILSQQVR